MLIVTGSVKRDSRNSTAARTSLVKPLGADATLASQLTAMVNGGGDAGWDGRVDVVADVEVVIGAAWIALVSVWGVQDPNGHGGSRIRCRGECQTTGRRYGLEMEIAIEQGITRVRRLRIVVSMRTGERRPPWRGARVSVHGETVPPSRVRRQIPSEKA